MASHMYDGGWHQINGIDGTWDADDYIALLVDDSYVFDGQHDFVNDVAANELAAPGYARFSMTGLARLIAPADGDADVYTGDDLDFGTPDATYTWRRVVIARFVTNDANSPLVGQIDMRGGVVTDGDPLVLTAPAEGFIREESS